MVFVILSSCILLTHITCLSVVIFTFVPLYVVGLFSSYSFSNFLFIASFEKVFSNVPYDCFLHTDGVEIITILGSEFMIFIKFVKFLAIISSNIIFLHSSLFIRL